MILCDQYLDAVTDQLNRPSPWAVLHARLPPPPPLSRRRRWQLRRRSWLREQRERLAIRLAPWAVMSEDD